MLNKNMQGMYCGVVTDNNDPDKKGRVKVLIEALKEKIETDWISVLQQYSSKVCGAFFIPEVGDQVLVGFLGHSADRAAVLGSFWSEKNKPPKTGENSGSDLNADGKNNLRFFKSKKGNKIIFDDTAGREKLQFIAAGDQNRIDLASEGQSISIQATNMIMSALKGVSVTAENGNIKYEFGHVSLSKGLTLNADNKLDLEALINLTMQGKNVKIN